MVERPAAAYLLALAVELKQAGIRAGRPDVAAKADEIIALLPDAGKPTGGTDAGNAVLKFLDGLGF
jgi:hypothetical protein